MDQKTALYDEHLKAGARMVSFAGFLMPVQYPNGVIAEHMAVRTKAGLFDVSHMGEIWLLGPGALPLLQTLLTNDMSTMADHACRYSPMCNEAGGVVDDVIVYKAGDERYMVVVNASNKDKDADWIRAHAGADVQVDDRSDQTALLALQGPMASAVMGKLVDQPALPAKNYTFVEDLVVAGVRCLVSRTGYTGEDGFELYCAAAEAPALWNALLAAGGEEGLVPCGLGARDTLRLEAAMPLYGHEMNDEISPLEAGLSMFVKMDKADFIGKTALAAAGKPARQRSGLRLTGRGIVREGAAVYRGDELVGTVTSGTLLPYVDFAGAMALLRQDCRELGTALEVEVRGRRIPCEVVPLPFYKRNKA